MNRAGIGARGHLAATATKNRDVIADPVQARWLLKEVSGFNGARLLLELDSKPRREQLTFSSRSSRRPFR